jgi:hypothetical protein
MKVLHTCPDCGGPGNRPHVAGALEPDEIRDPNRLDKYKELDLCERCGGAGKCMIEITLVEG